MCNKIKKFFFRRVACSFVAAFFLLATVGTGTLRSQSIASETSNSSCNAGGEMWVCGTAEVVQATSDFDTNCSDWDYECGATLRTIINVCTPNMQKSYIYEHCDA